MNKNTAPFFKTLFYIILILSIALRVALACANKGYANDDHLEISSLIIDKGKIPEPQDCWQCYQSKFYHYTVAKLWSFFKIDDNMDRKKLGQLVNALAGILTILICWLIIKKQPFRDSIKLVCFSLIALNPGLIAINSQATNDSFIILFGTIVLYSLYKLMAKPTVINFLVVILFSILAGLTKNNSLIILIGVIMVLILKIVSTKNYKFSLNKGYLGGLIIFIITTIPAVGYFGEYYGKYKKYGKPVVYNTPTGDIPHFFKKTNFARPGVQSIAGGYFTFRIFDMIKNPVITNDDKIYPLHRTSVWSQLYGRAHFIYFDFWPAGWQCTDPKMMSVGRVALSLALFPSLFLLLGIFMEFRVWSSLFFRRSLDFLKENNDWIFHIFLIGNLIFIVLFTVVGRDYSFMKTIYILPGLLAMVIPMLRGLDYAYKYILKFKASVIFYAIILILLASYVIPIMHLISRLD